MACALTQGHTATGCKEGPGGAKRILVTEFANKNTITVADGVVSAIALETGTQFRSYELNYAKGKGKWTDHPSVENGNVSFIPHVEFDMDTIAQTYRQEMKLLALNTLIFIVQTGDDTYILLGYNNGMDLISGEVDGARTGEWKGMKMVFEGREAEPAYSVGSGLIAALLSPAS